MTEMDILWAAYWFVAACAVLLGVVGVVMCALDIRESWK